MSESSPKSESKVAPFRRDSLPARVGGSGAIRPFHLRRFHLNWVSVRRDYRYEAHLHGEYELLIPLRGLYRCALNGAPVEVGPGRLLFVQEGDRHEDFYRRGNEFAAILFTLHDLGGARWPHGVFAPEAPASARDVALAAGSRLEALAGLILAEGKTRRHPSLALEALGEAFFWLLAEKLPPRHLSAPFRNNLGDNAFRRRLLDCFARNLREKPRMAVLAAQLGMSERSLDTRCQALLGTSPARAFAAYRIDEAARLLAGGLRVQEVAARLGFADPFHFSKVFKRHLGHPPSAMDR